MQPVHPTSLTRRAFLRAAVAAGAIAVVGSCSDDGAPTAGERGTGGGGREPTSPNAGPAAGQALEPTPSCDHGEVTTPPQTEGPYFTPGSPERADIRGGALSGTTLVLSGSVVDTACRPVGRALIDVWQADSDGEYDNDGYRLRGHLFSGEDGSYRLVTVVPGRYAGRTRHIHVKVQRPGGAILTTQLYFPGEAGNVSDGLFRQELLMRLEDGPDGKAGTFTFVLA